MTEKYSYNCVANFNFSFFLFSKISKRKIKSRGIKILKKKREKRKERINRSNRRCLREKVGEKSEELTGRNR